MLFHISYQSTQYFRASTYIEHRDVRQLNIKFSIHLVLGVAFISLMKSLHKTTLWY